MMNGMAFIFLTSSSSSKLVHYLEMAQSLPRYPPEKGVITIRVWLKGVATIGSSVAVFNDFAFANVIFPLM